MSCCGSSSDKGAEAARAEEERRQEAIRQGVRNVDAQFTGFNEDFYSKRAKAFEDFALPQLAQQTQDTTKQLIYQQARRGMLDSSATRYLTNRLKSETAKQQQGITDQGQTQANALRQSVNQAKGDLYNQATLTADPAMAQRQAISAAATLQLPSSFAPVSNFLQGWANTYLADRVAQTYDSNPYSRTSNVTSAAETPITRRY
jgi:hypothetical protein